MDTGDVDVPQVNSRVGARDAEESETKSAHKAAIRPEVEGNSMRCAACAHDNRDRRATSPTI